MKSNGKRSHRMSPTEFSSYIKQRAIIQQQQQQSQMQQMFASITPQQRPRSLSPTPNATMQQSQQQSQQQQQQQQQQVDANSFLLLASTANIPYPPGHFSPNQRQSLYDSGYLSDIFSNASTSNGQQQNGMLTPNNNSTPAKTNGSQRLGSANALSLFLDKGPFNTSANSVSGMSSGGSSFKTSTTTDSSSKGFGSGIDNFNVGGMSYPNQHLLMAN